MFVSIVVVLIVIAVLTATVLVLMPEEEEEIPPTGNGWLAILNSTAAKVDFRRIVPPPRPTELRITLEMNETFTGSYRFQNDEDGWLVFESGMDLATIYYSDLADNREVNMGDRLRLENLYPGSEYSMRILWAATNELIAEGKFKMPPG
ncbi:MAG: hypothetical protein KAW09_11045, partial [Thermoplasmata archaeon]|nr:hypothetical protein [Thermoplasmata archaeon]